jgi:hypothetical protein
LLDSSKAEKDNKSGGIGAVKGAVEGNFGAVKGPEGAVILAKSSREGLAGPGNPEKCPQCVVPDVVQESVDSILGLEIRPSAAAF